jgi:UDP-galactose-lipid carrier transferase
LASLIDPLAGRWRLVPAGNLASMSPAFHAAARTSSLFIADCLTFLVVNSIVACLWSLMSLRPDSGALADMRTTFLSLMAPAACIIAYLIGRGRYSTRISFWNETRLVMCVGLCAIGIETSLGVFTCDIGDRSAAIAAITLFSVFATTGGRLAKHALASLRLWPLPAIIIGNETRAADAEMALQADASLGYQVVGKIDPSAVISEQNELRLKPLLTRFHAICFLIAVDDLQQQCTLIEIALRERIPFAMVVLPGFSCQFTQVFGQEVMLLSHWVGLSRPMARLLKAAFDVTAAALLLLVASPLFLIIALAVRSDGGPALFAHRRLGVAGRHFQCLKFRTMVVDAAQVLQQVLATDLERAAEWRATQKLRNDPRITRLGRFLRKTSLDELPQLINVIRLEMSLVGPRPIVDSETSFYGEDIVHYYATRPGLTGLWQVSGRSDTSYSRRVRFDVWYVNNWTIWHDIAVLLKTIPAVLKRQGAR